MKSRWLCFLTILTLAFSACSGGGGGGGGSGEDESYQYIPDGKDIGNPAEWTYMVYMGADNNLSFAGLQDLNEMEKVGSNEKVNIVLQAEFSTFFTDFNAEHPSYSDFNTDHPSYNGDTRRFRIKKDMDPNAVDLEYGTTLGINKQINMADPDTLAEFIKWAAQTYPAKRYALVIWDHGAGWKAVGLVKGAVQDVGSDSFMSLPQLAQGVRDSGVHLDIINFDACLMAMYEVAYEFLGLADYMVFSEEVEPGAGDPYDSILKALKENPGMDAAGLSTLIVDKYVASYADQRSQKITKSAVDMSKMEGLHSSVVQLAGAIVNNYETVSGAVGSARTNSQRYEYPTNLDLYDFAKRLAKGLLDGDAIKNKAIDVMAAVDSTVIRNKTLNSVMKDSHGLAIYVPGTNQISYNQAQNDLLDYADLACNQTLNRADAVWLEVAEKLTDGIDATTLEDGGFAFYITWDSDADLDLNVCEPDRYCYAPWMGQTTFNGYFSGDSYDTGYSEEYYSANDYVQPGSYDVFIEYWDDGRTSKSANVTFWVYDPAVSDEWENYGAKKLDFSNWGIFDEVQTFDELNGYSNFWYPGWIDRAMPKGGVVLNVGTRSLRVLTKRRKKTQYQVEGKR